MHCCPVQNVKSFIPNFPDLKKQLNSLSLEIPDLKAYMSLTQDQLMELLKKNMGLDNVQVTDILKLIFRKYTKIPGTDIDAFDFLPAF